MSEIKEFTPSNQSKPYTIEDWHAEFDDLYLTEEDFDDVSKQEKETQAWLKWYSLPENQSKAEVSRLTNLNGIFGKLNALVTELGDGE